MEESHQTPAQSSGRASSESAKAKNKGHGCLLMGLCILALAIAAGIYAYMRGGASSESKISDARATRPIPVVTSLAHLGDYDIYIRGLGSVAALNTVTIRSRVDGQLLKVGFKEGEFIQQGAMIAEIDPTPYQVQKEQAMGQKARDMASLENARRDLARYTQAGPEAISQQQIDTAKSQVENYEGALKVDEAAIHAAQVQLDYCHITAPISGRAGLRLVDVGNLIHAGDTTGIVVITQLEPIAISFTIAEDSLQQVHEAMKNNPHVQVDVYGRDNQTKIATGALLALDNQIDPTTGTLRIKAQFDNKDGRLFPNQFVNVRMLVKTLRNVVMVDSAAVQHGPGGSSFVYVAHKNDKEPGDQATYAAELRPISTISENGVRAVVSKGLAPGEIVVTAGVDKLIDGSKITFRNEDKSAASKPSAPQQNPGAAR